MIVSPLLSGVELAALLCETRAARAGFVAKSYD